MISLQISGFFIDFAHDLTLAPQAPQELRVLLELGASSQQPVRCKSKEMA